MFYLFHVFIPCLSYESAVRNVVDSDDKSFIFFEPFNIITICNFYWHIVFVPNFNSYYQQWCSIRSGAERGAERSGAKRFFAPFRSGALEIFGQTFEKKWPKNAIKVNFGKIFIWKYFFSRYPSWTVQKTGF